MPTICDRKNDIETEEKEEEDEEIRLCILSRDDI